MCCCWCVGVDDETRATTRKKAAKKKKPFYSRSSVSSLSVPKERDERKTNEKEIQRYLKMRLLSRSLPSLLFSLWLLFSLFLWYKKND